MSGELIDSWQDHDRYVQRLLTSATREVRIFDADLSALKIERPEVLAALEHMLRSAANARLSIVLRDAGPLRNSRYPRLSRLLSLYSHRTDLIECAPRLTALNDALLLIDERHALIRFHQDAARSRVYLDEAGQCQPYLARFREILAEGGEGLSMTPLGL